MSSNLKKKGNNLLIITYLFLLTSVSNIFPQDSLFNKITIGFNLSTNINKIEMHEYWDEGNQYEINIRSPFYQGNFQFGVSFSHLSPKIPDMPNFRLFMYYLQWDKVLFNYQPIEVTAGVKFGISQMNFDKTEKVFISSDLYEHEIFAGLISSLRYKTSQSFHVNLNVNYISILTKKTISMYFVGAGFDYTFDTPQWLREFLE